MLSKYLTIPFIALILMFSMDEADGKSKRIDRTKLYGTWTSEAKKVGRITLKYIFNSNGRYVLVKIKEGVMDVPKRVKGKWFLKSRGKRIYLRLQRTGWQRIWFKSKKTIVLGKRYFSKTSDIQVDKGDNYDPEGAHPVEPEPPVKDKDSK